MSVDNTLLTPPLPPGAATSTVAPKFEYDALPPLRPVAATVTTPEQFAGEKLAALALLLPAATTTDAPRERAELIAFCVVAPQDPPPPSEMLSTFAGLALVGTPDTVPPDTQTIASAMSEVKPPHLPSTRAGTTLALNATPATPLPLLVTAAMVPATCVPCQLDASKVAGSPGPHSLGLIQSPGSLASLSRPLPSLATKVSEMKS